MKEIRWHGRGGQGAKTASQLLADINLQEGKFVQSFPEYGPERSGAPIKAFNRVADADIKIHSGVDQPDIVAVIDPTLLTAANPTEGLTSDSIMLVNTPNDSEWVREKTGFEGTIHAFDATKIANEAGSGYANVPVLGGLASILGSDIEIVVKEVEKALGKKLPEEVVEKNIEALRKGYETIGQTVTA